MQPDLISEIAKAIVRDELLLNWQFYALIGCLMVVTSAVGHLIASYCKKRGATLATKADMQEILRQVSATTQATEQVRSAISRTDWAEREWRTTRRLKLEDLLCLAYSIDQWLDLQQDKWVYRAPVVSDSGPLPRLKVVAALYFPELKDEALAVWVTHHDLYRLILDIGKKANDSREAMDATAYKLVLDEYSERHKPLYESARLAIAGLEHKASTLMTEITGA